MGTFRLPSGLASATVVVFALAACPHPLLAQDVNDLSVPAHLAVVEGSATVDRDDQTQPATLSMPLVAGDRLRTSRGRVEVLFPDGSALDVDEYSTVEVQAPTLLRITAGRVMLMVAGASNPQSAPRFQLDTPVASATTDGPGEFRVAVLSGASGVQTELAVLRGTGALVTERGSVALRAGERSVAWDNAPPSYPQAFNSARFDAFDQWASARRDQRLGSTTSAQYLPPDLRMYGGTFDRYGSWQNEGSYGNVWYPAVAPEWRPYYNGYWSSVPSYGWTWIGLDVWSWPTHHYGRWGYSHNRWFWRPDRRWAPAWVSWGAAPGYVSWCPLGFDNRPAFALSVTAGAPRDGWVFLPRRHFGARGEYVHRYAIAPQTLPRNTPFVMHARAPIAPPRTVVRNLVGAPAGGAGVAVPRGQSVGASRQPSLAGAQEVQPLGGGGRRPEIPGRGQVGGVSPGARLPNPERGLPSDDAGFKPPLPDTTRARERYVAPAGGAPGPAVAAPRGVPQSPYAGTPPSGAYSRRPADPVPGQAPADRGRMAVPRSAPPAGAPIGGSAPTEVLPPPATRGPGAGRMPVMRQPGPPPQSAVPPAAAPPPSAQQSAPAAPAPRSAPTAVPRSGPANGAPAANPPPSGRSAPAESAPPAQSREARPRGR